MLVLDQEQTTQALPFAQLIAALEKGFCTKYEAPLRHHHTLQNVSARDDTLLLMPAWQMEKYGGVKIVNVVPENVQRGLGAITASYILFLRETGEHLMLMDGGELTARRTAAASALAASKVAREDSRSLLVVGAGRVGSNVPFAYRNVFPIERVGVFDQDTAKADDLVVRLRNDGIEATVEKDLEAAVRSVDIVSCATLAQTPILRGAWLQHGQHVDLIGSFTPQTREADDDVVRKATVFIDTEHAKVETGDIVVPMHTGLLSENEIEGTLIDLCRAGAYKRKSSHEITMFKSVGSAIEDLAAAILAYEASQLEI